MFKAASLQKVPLFSVHFALSERGGAGPDLACCDHRTVASQHLEHCWDSTPPLTLTCLEICLIYEVFSFPVLSYLRDKEVMKGNK